MKLFPVIAAALLGSACGFSGGASSTDAAPAVGDSGGSGGSGGSGSGSGALDAFVPDAFVPDAFVADAPPPPHACAGYVAVTGSGTTSTYKKFNTGTTFAAAETRCEQDTARLVIPETTAEAKAVWTFVNPDAASPYYWIGVSDLDKNQVWTEVVTNATFANPPWASGQPNDASVIGPAVLVDSDGLFYDFRADAGQEFACECVP